VGWGNGILMMQSESETIFHLISNKPYASQGLRALQFS